MGRRKCHFFGKPKFHIPMISNNVSKPLFQMLISVSKFARITSLFMSGPWSQFSSRDNPEWWLCPLRAYVAQGPGYLQENLFLRTSAHPTKVAGFVPSCPFPQILPSCGTPEVCFFYCGPCFMKPLRCDRPQPWWRTPKTWIFPQELEQDKAGWASIREVWSHHIFTKILLG